MRRWPFLVRLSLSLLLAAGLTLGGFSFSAAAVAATPMPADCPHHSGMVMDHGSEQDKAGHDHGSKRTGCQCPLMTCSGWTLAPLAFDLVSFDPATLPRLATAADRFAPHPPGVPLQPPRA